jgi:hypothetical protein
MRAEKAIFTLLAADAGVAAQVGARIYPSRIPQNTTMPALVYEFISGQEHPVIDASAGRQLMRSRIQVTAMGKNYAEVKNTLEAVRIACLYKHGVIGGVQVVSITRNGIGPDLRDDQLALYLQSIDFMVTHYET